MAKGGRVKAGELGIGSAPTFHRQRQPQEHEGGSRRRHYSHDQSNSSSSSSSRTTTTISTPAVSPRAAVAQLECGQ